MNAELVALLGVILGFLASVLAKPLVTQSLIENASLEGQSNVFLFFKPLDVEQLDSVVNFMEQSRPDPVPKTASLDESNVGWSMARRALISEMLQKHVEISQRNMTASLKAMGYEFESFWINNSIFVKEAPLHLLVLLSYSDDLVEIAPDRVISRMPPPSKLISVDADEELHLTEEGSVPAAPWNLAMINVPEAWNMTKGARVTVANIDTGVHFKHTSLRAKYRGQKVSADGALLGEAVHEYNWFDPRGTSAEPNDDHGHGTHTMGTIVGDDVGVAPGARWIAARGCTEQDCRQYDLTASAQWVMCPTDKVGKNARCELGADVVSNSWGGDGSDGDHLTWFLPIVKSWIAAGMIPVFAQGNSGPLCATTGSPGDLEQVVGVGSVNRMNSLSFFSSRGPGNDGLGYARQKPDLVAPGDKVKSTFRDGSFVVMSGTSMAAPHVSGVVALMRSIDPTLGFQQARDILIHTAVTKGLRAPELGRDSCGGIKWDRFPNYHYGYGLIDAEAAVKKSGAPAKKHDALTLKKRRLK